MLSSASFSNAALFVQPAPSIIAAAADLSLHDRSADVTECVAHTHCAALLCHQSDALLLQIHNVLTLLLTSLHSCHTLRSNLVADFSQQSCHTLWRNVLLLHCLHSQLFSPLHAHGLARLAATHTL